MTRFVCGFDVGDKECTGIWDDELKKGRLVWVDGKAFDLELPRDQGFVDKIIKRGRAEAEADMVEAAESVSAKQEQFSLF